MENDEVYCCLKTYSLAHVEAKNFAESSLANDAFLLFSVDCTPITTEFSSASFVLWSTYKVHAVNVSRANVGVQM